MRGTAGARVARVIAAVGLAAAACGCGGATGSSNVTIMVAWSGPELAAFESVIQTFEEQSGISVDVEPTRALTQELDADLAEADPPDVAALPSIGAIGTYAGQGELKPLDGLVDTAAYGPPWSGLMRTGRGDHVYAVPVKADVKSLIWYDPTVFRRSGYAVPATWPQLLTLSKSIEDHGGSPWCLALSSTPTSGWPGTDWIADILLSTYGPGTYQKWVSGELSWTSGPVQQAWQMWGQLVGGGHAVYGGRDAALVQHVESGGINPSLTGCYLSHGTLVDQGFAVKTGQPAPKFGTSYDFFPFPAPGSAPSGTAPSGTAASGTAASRAPASGAIQVSADFVGLFHDTTAARALIRYLTSTAAQREWVSYPGADGFSADNQVPVSAYPGPATRQIAMLLTSGQRELCFGAADAMSPDLGAAFDHAILRYLTDPAALTSTVLRELSKVPADSSSAPSVCGRLPATQGRH
jgi:alpha-glucoside transport system substrate-binding protein